MVNSQIVLKDIKKALKNDEFIFYYQPKVSLLTGHICGAEALIRWHRPNGDTVPPCDFIPLAESSGYISKITRAMFQKLIIDVAIFDDIVGEFHVSINASTKDFNDSKFVSHIRKAHETKQVNLERIQIELTESCLLEESDDIYKHFSSLIGMGISLVMDDFGTGFSSIDILSKFPFSTIKLDQGVVSRMGSSLKDKTIVESSIKMGHNLGLDIVAEGIENEFVYKHLQNAGCTIGQGYWISEPLPLSAFLELVKEKNRWPSTPAGLLYLAQIDHLQWRKALIDGIFSVSERKKGDTYLRGNPESNHHLCKLGQWYYGIGYEEFSSFPEFIQIQQPHEELHQIGNQLIEAAENNATREELVEIMRNLSKVSSVVIGLLQELENKVL